MARKEKARFDHTLSGENRLFNTMNSALKMMDFVLKLTDFALKMMDSAFKFDENYIISRGGRCGMGGRAER